MDDFSSLDFSNIFDDFKEENDYFQNLKDGKITFDKNDPKAVSYLMHAAETGDLEKLKALKDGKADFNIQDEKGNTALMNAIVSKQLLSNPANVVFLCQNTSDFDIKNKYGENAAMLACYYDCPDKLMHVLVRATKDSSVDKDFLTAALSHDNLSMETVGLILAKATGKDVAEVTKNIKTACLSKDMLEESTAKKQLLILAGANPKKYRGKYSLDVISAMSNIMEQQAQRIKEQQQEISHLKPQKEKQGDKSSDFNAMLLNKSMER